MAYVEDKDKGFMDILKGAKSLDGKTLVAGVLQEAGKTSTGTSLVDVAVYNEYGTRHIPARPFMRIASTEHGKKWQEHAEKAAIAVMDGRIKAERAVELVGNEVVGDIQQIIGSDKLEANAPATIKRKKSDSPLIDTGRLRQSISFRVEG